MPVDYCSICERPIDKTDAQIYHFTFNKKGYYEPGDETARYHRGKHLLLCYVCGGALESLTDEMNLARRLAGKVK